MKMVQLSSVWKGAREKGIERYCATCLPSKGHGLEISKNGTGGGSVPTEAGAGI